MESERILSFDTLMDYVDGKLEPSDSGQVKKLLNQDDEAQELVEGLEAIFANEQLDRAALETSFTKLENAIEDRIRLYGTFNNHVIELNRQLRSAAAIFVLGFTFSILLLGGLPESHSSQPQVYSGPYDLALGSKIAP